MFFNIRQNENKAVVGFNRGQFDVAKSHYLRAVYIALGGSPKIPIEADENGGGRQWKNYAQLDAMSKLLVLKFFVGIGRCSLKMGYLDEVCD